MDQATNLRVGYRILEDNITVALQTQVGDRQRLSALRDSALMFIGAVDNVSDRDVRLRLELMSTMKHKSLFTSEELELVASNIKKMVELLEVAEGQSLDPPTVMDMVIFRTIFFELLVFFTFTLLTLHFAY